MPFSNRLMKTEAMMGRSAATAVSFSTMEASVTACSLVSITGTGVRLVHNSASSAVCAACMSSTSFCLVMPRRNT